MADLVRSAGRGFIKRNRSWKDVREQQTTIKTHKNASAGP